MKKENINITVQGQSYKTNTSSIGITETLLSRLFLPVISNFPGLFNQIKLFIAKKYFKPSRAVGFFKKDITISNNEINSNIDLKIPDNFTFVESHQAHPIRMASQNYL